MLMQPGEIITPGEHKSEGIEVSIPRDEPARPVTTPVTDPTPAPPEPAVELTQPTQAPIEQPAPITQPTEPSIWQNNQESDDLYSVEDMGPIQWTASEFVEHEKDKSWFVGFACLTILAVVVIYLITQEEITAIVVAITAGLFAVSARRKPQTLAYHMNQSGVTVGDRYYSYETFKSFSVLDDEAFSSIQLTSLKRFAIPVSLYYPPEEEEKIIAMLGNFLPHEERSHDPVDRLMRKVRF